MGISELQGVVNCYLDATAANCPHISEGVCGDGECADNPSISCPVTSSGPTASVCTGGSDAGLPCGSSDDCDAIGCSNPCGTNGVCIPVEPAKGIDGLPCTADDEPSSRGLPRPMLQTTGHTSAVVVDANNIPGAQIAHLAYAGGVIDPGRCSTALEGVPFDCAQLASATPSAQGAGLAVTVPIVDGQTGDGVLSILLSER